jgi:hypothetical protein
MCRWIGKCHHRHARDPGSGAFSRSLYRAASESSRSPSTRTRWSRRPPPRRQRASARSTSQAADRVTEARRASASIGRHALLAQLVEHFHGKEGVIGSSPIEGLGGFACSAASSRFRVAAHSGVWKPLGSHLGSRSPPPAPIAPASPSVLRDVRVRRCGRVALEIGDGSGARPPALTTFAGVPRRASVNAMLIVPELRPATCCSDRGRLLAASLLARGVELCAQPLGHRRLVPLARGNGEDGVLGVIDGRLRGPGPAVGLDEDA